MNKQIIVTILFLHSFFCFRNNSYGQPNIDSLINDNTTLDLKNDTLYAGTGAKFFMGQKLVIGTAAGNEGYYRSIIHKKAALVPSIWGQDKNYPYAIENHVNKKKSREIVKKSLVAGNSLTIKKIFFSKTGKPYFYMVALSSDAGDFNADIRLALILGELVLQP